MNITDQELEAVIDIMERAEANYKIDYISERNKRKWIKKFPFIKDKKFKFIGDKHFSLEHISYDECITKNMTSNFGISTDLHDVFILKIGDGCGAYRFCSDDIYYEVTKKIREFESTLEYSYEDVWNYRFAFHSDVAEKNIKKLDDFIKNLKNEIPEMAKEKKVARLKKELESLTN